MDTDIHTEETAQIQDDSGCLDTGCGCGCCIILSYLLLSCLLIVLGGLRLLSCCFYCIKRLFWLIFWLIYAKI